MKGKCDWCGKEFEISEKVWTNGIIFLCGQCFRRLMSDENS